MTKITAKGKTEFGNISIVVIGEKTVKEIECSELIKGKIKNAIHNADGTMANGYNPEPDTMLQAYAYLTNLFGDDHVHVDGDLDEIPWEPGVIY